MPDILQPKDIPNYDKMCKLSAALIKIREEENKKTTKYEFINSGKNEKEKI